MTSNGESKHSNISIYVANRRFSLIDVENYDFQCKLNYSFNTHNVHITRTLAFKLIYNFDSKNNYFS